MFVKNVQKFNLLVRIFGIERFSGYLKSNIPKLFFIALIVFCVELSPMFPNCNKNDVVYKSFINNHFFRVGNDGVETKCIALLASETEWFSPVIMPLGCL